MTSRFIIRSLIWEAATSFASGGGTFQGGRLSSLLVLAKRLGTVRYPEERWTL